MTHSDPNPNQKAHRESSENAPPSHLYFDLALILIITAATIVVVFTPLARVTAVRTVAGLLFIFFVPGYALLAAVFPKKESITNVERVIFSLVFSIIIVGGMSLLLSHTKFGLSAPPLVACISVFVVVSTCAAYILRYSLSLKQPFAVSIPRLSDVRRALTTQKVTGKLDKTLVVALISVLVVSLVATGYLLATPIGGGPYTELYILGPDGKAQDYPSQLRLGEEQSVIVGVTNHEQRQLEYTLVTTLNGTTRSSTLFTKQFNLENNQNWEQTVVIRPDQSGTNLKVNFLLYANNNSTPVQTTHLWVNVTA